MHKVIWPGAALIWHVLLACMGLRVEPKPLPSMPVVLEASTDSCLGSGLLTPTGAGALYLGMSTDSVRLLCSVVEEVAVSESAATLLVVDLGSDSVRVWTHNDRVDWIDVGSSLLRTSGGIGVGSTLGRVLSVDGVEGGFGEGLDVFVLYTEVGSLCGLSFRVDAATALALTQITRSRLNPAETEAALLPFRKTGRVAAVWVIGRSGARCPG